MRYRKNLGLCIRTIVCSCTNYLCELVAKMVQCEFELCDTDTVAYLNTTSLLTRCDCFPQAERTLLERYSVTVLQYYWSCQSTTVCLLVCHTVYCRVGRYCSLLYLPGYFLLSLWKGMASYKNAMDMSLLLPVNWSFTTHLTISMVLCSNTLLQQRDFQIILFEYLYL